MSTVEIDDFAQRLIASVRDAAVRSNDLRIDGQHVIGQRWRDAAVGDDCRRLLHVAVPDIVDSTLFFLLNAIDHGILDLVYVASNGQQVSLRLAGAGELAGWLAGQDWLRQYSKERVYDNFPTQE
jgi:hypothetical protein